MKVKRKNNKSDLSDFLRYVRGEMTLREENAFQRKLQKDPFADEASEGLKEIDPMVAEKDIQRLGKKLKKRILQEHRVLLYRIAASVAVLMIISSIIIIVTRNKPEEQIAYLPSPAPAQEIQETPKEKGAEQAVEMEKPAPVSRDKGKEVTDTVPVTQIETIEKEGLKEDTVISGVQDAVAARTDEPVVAVVEERAMAAKAALPRRTNYAEYEKEDSVAAYTPPIPVNGRASFDQYIEYNIRRPDTISARESVVVVLNFLVTSDGIIDSIKVERSPGKIFSDEAIRLIKEGPAWKSAMKNGKAISDTVTISIEFD
jgi:outer membrane biosynthesis protein TonB